MGPTSERLKEARRAERELCELLDMPHFGGPGEPDCRDCFLHLCIDKKDWRRPLPTSAVKQVIAKQRDDCECWAIQSSAGFSERARDWIRGEGDSVLATQSLGGEIALLCSDPSDSVVLREIRSVFEELGVPSL